MSDADYTPQGLPRKLLRLAMGEITTRKQKKGAAPLRAWELPSRAMRDVLLFLMQHADADGHNACPSTEALARAAGVGDRHASRLRADLDRSEWIRINGIARIDPKTGELKRHPLWQPHMRMLPHWLVVCSINVQRVEAAIGAHQAHREGRKHLAVLPLFSSAAQSVAGTSCQPSGHLCESENGHQLELGGGENGHLWGSNCGAGHLWPKNRHHECPQKEYRDIDRNPSADMNSQKQEEARRGPALDLDGEARALQAVASETLAGIEASKARPMFENEADFRAQVRARLAERWTDQRCDQWMRSWFDPVQWCGSHVLMPSKVYATRWDEVLGHRWLSDHHIGVRIAPPPPRVAEERRA